jgi:hypothetical protein
MQKREIKGNRQEDEEMQKREIKGNGCYWLQRGGEIIGGSERGRVFCRRDGREKGKKIYMVFIVLGCTILNNTTQFDCSIRNNATN